MNITKQQKNLLILLGLAILSWLLFFRRKNTSEESSLADITDWKNIGNDFYVPVGDEKLMAKKYIDGTIQDGFLINENNEYRGGQTDPTLLSKQALLGTKNTELTNLSNRADYLTLESTKANLDSMGNQTNCSQNDRSKGYKSWIASNGQVWCDSQSTNIYNTASTQLQSWDSSKRTLRIEIGNLQNEINSFKGKEKSYIAVPTNVGIRKSDGKGNYFYFEELPEWKRNEIKRLEDLKAAAEKAEAEANAAEERRKEQAKIKAKKEREKFELAKKEAERKAAEERMLAERKSQELAKEKEDKNKKQTRTIIIIVAIVVIAIVGFLIWKKYKK